MITRERQLVNLYNFLDTIRNNNHKNYDAISKDLECLVSLIEDIDDGDNILKIKDIVSVDGISVEGTFLFAIKNVKHFEIFLYTSIDDEFPVYVRWYEIKN